VTRQVLDEIAIWEFPLLDVIWRRRRHRVTGKQEIQSHAKVRHCHIMAVSYNLLVYGIYWYMAHQTSCD